LSLYNNNAYFNLLVFSAAQVPDNDEQFVPDFHSENCKYSMPFDLHLKHEHF